MMGMQGRRMRSEGRHRGDMCPERPEHQRSRREEPLGTPWLEMRWLEYSPTGTPDRRVRRWASFPWVWFLRAMLPLVDRIPLA